MKNFLCCMLVILFVFISLAGCMSKEKSDMSQNIETSDEMNSAGESTDLYVFIAASLKNSMEEIKTLYAKKNPNVNIIYNADSAGTLQKQIEEGAECDVFFSAATKQMTELDSKGMVEKNTVKNLLQNKVVLIKPKGSHTSITGFENITNAKNIALAGEDVPVGAYAREIFKNIGNLDDVMKMEINECSNVTAVLAAVTEQSNEAGIVYATDAESVSDSVEIITTASEKFFDKPVIYPVGQIINKDADESEKNAAKEFIDYLASDEAHQVFRDYGFTIYQE